MSAAIVVTTPEELGKIVQAAVEKALQERPADRTEWISLKKTGLPPASLKKAIDEGRMRGAIVGRERFVHAGDLERWMTERCASSTDTRVSVAPTDELDDFDAAVARARAERAA